MNSISAQELKKMLDQGSDLVLLDVRTEMEFARGKLSGAINLPLDEFLDQINQVCPDKQTKIVVYCLSGSRSAIAVLAMLDLGYENVFDLTHGLLAWRNNHFPMDTLI